MEPAGTVLEPVIDESLPPRSAVVVLRGIIDLQARPVLTAAATLIVLAQPATVCVDLSAATYFGPEGLRFLANLARCDGGEGGERCAITVAQPSPMARRALEITGFAQVLTMTGERCSSFSSASAAGQPVASVVLPRAA